MYKQQRRLSWPAGRTQIRRAGRDIAGQTQPFFEKEGGGKAFASHSHFMHNAREKMTQMKSRPLEGAKEIEIWGKRQRV